MHGEPSGEEECWQTKLSYGWPEDAKFLAPDGVYEHFEEGVGARGAAARTEWREQFRACGTLYPEVAAGIGQMQRRELPPGLGSESARVPRWRRNFSGKDRGV